MRGEGSGVEEHDGFGGEHGSGARVLAQELHLYGVIDKMGWGVVYARIFLGSSSPPLLPLLPPRSLWLLV